MRWPSLWIPWKPFSQPVKRRELVWFGHVTRHPIQNSWKMVDTEVDVVRNWGASMNEWTGRSTQHPLGLSQVAHPSYCWVPLTPLPLPHDWHQRAAAGYLVMDDDNESGFTILAGQVQLYSRVGSWLLRRASLLRQCP